jgi:hypothetical protein
MLVAVKALHLIVVPAGFADDKFCKQGHAQLLAVADDHRYGRFAQSASLEPNAAARSSP